MATLPSEGQLLYHITHIDNMQSILNHGLISRNQIEANEGIQFVDIADQEILSKRKSYRENLSKYVLFHFYPKNPFDYAIAHKYNAENLAIIAIKRDLAKINDFKIIPSHPLDRNEPEILSYDEGLKKIRWDILDDISNRNYYDQDIKTACMAECVLEYIVQPEAFAYIYVLNDEVKAKLEKMENADKVNIVTNGYMFYHK